MTSALPSSFELTAPAAKASLTQRIGLRLAISIFAFAVVAIVNGLIVIDLLRQRDQDIQTAGRQADNLTVLLVEHALQSFGRVEQTLGELASELTPSMLALPPSNQTTSALLQDRLATVPHVSELLVLEAGRIRNTAASSMSLDPMRADPPTCGAFQVGARLMQNERPFGSVYIAPLNSGDGCTARTVMIRKINRPDQSEAHSIAAIIRGGYFRAFYDSLTIGREGAVSLWRSDGALLASSSARSDRIGRVVAEHPIIKASKSGKSSDVLFATSRLTETKRLYAFRTIPGFPLIASVGLEMDDVLAAWRKRLQSAIGTGVLVTIGILIMAVMLMRMAARGDATREALRESEQRFRDFAASSSDWYWEQDENLRFTYLSPVCGQHSGMGAVQHYGKTRREVGGLGPTEKEWAEHDATLAARKPLRNFRMFRITPEGETRHFQVSGVPVFDAEGKFRGYRGTGTDITDGVTAKEALQAVVDAVPAMINAKDLDSRYVMMNAYQARMYGVDPDAAVGKTAAELLGKSYGGYTRSKDQEVIDSGKPLPFFDERYACADGIERDWLTTKVPIFDRTGRVNRVITVALDITTQKGIERRLQDAQNDLQNAKEAAETASHAKTNFLANMSHELRTPLNAILGFSEIMEKQMMGPLGSERYREFAAGIHRSGVMLLQHINDVLDMAKIESGKRELNREWFDVADAANDALLVVRQRAEEGGVTLDVQMNGALPPLHADRRAVRQILVNLLTNAVKFTPRGGTVSLAVDDHNDRIKLTVSDTGVGIAPEMLEQLGTPFFQVAQSMTRSHEGTGLGLALTKSLIAMHGGEFAIDSTPGRGTTVSVSLPLERQRDAA